MSTPRNAPCPCGSGRKHKHCCAGKTPWYRHPRLMAALVGLVVVGGLVLAGLILTQPETDGTSAPPGPAPEGKVWSPEHGHWHDA